MGTVSAASRSIIPKGAPNAKSPMMSKARALNQSSDSTIAQPLRESRAPLAVGDLAARSQIASHLRRSPWTVLWM